MSKKSTITDELFIMVHGGLFINDSSTGVIKEYGVFYLRIARNN
ncbi:hypothetical protein [Candidatus Tisiphia endosymbiont of Oplodontha viridula]